MADGDYKSYAQDARFAPLIQRGIITEGQACVLQKIEQIDGTRLNYAGRDPDPDHTGHIFVDNAGRRANAGSPGSRSEYVQYDTLQQQRDIVEPHGGFRRNSSFETRHYSSNTKAIINNGVSQPAGQQDPIGHISRDPTEREKTIHNEAQQCYQAKISSRSTLIPTKV